MRQVAFEVVLLLSLLAALGQGQPLALSAQDLQRSHPLAQHLLVFLPALPFTQGGSTWWSPLQRFHGVTVNNPVWQSSPQLEWPGEMAFNSSNSQWLQIGAANDFDLANMTFTVSLDLHRIAPAAGVTQTLLGTRHLGTGMHGWIIRINTNNTVHARIVDAIGGGAARRTTVSTSITNGQPHNLTVVFRTDTVTEANNDIQIYYDGVPDQGALTHDGSGPYSPAAQVLTVTSSPDNIDRLTGSLRQLRIWRRGFSAAEVARIAKPARGAYELFEGQPVGPLIPMNPRRNVSE